MNKLNKKITVHYYNIDASVEYFENFISTFKANLFNGNNAKIFNLRSKKHLIKIASQYSVENADIFVLSVVRERDTWQAITN